jgi:phage shock protein A
MKKRIFALFFALLMLFTITASFTGCMTTTIISAGAVIDKCVGWLFWWKKDDPATQYLSTEERMKQAFSAYVEIANNAMEGVKGQLIPAKPADTEDIFYVQNTIDENNELDPYNFFAIYIEMYSRDYPNDPTYENIASYVTEAEMGSFFLNYYLKTETATVYKGGDGTVYPTKEKADEIAAERAGLRGQIAGDIQTIQTNKDTIEQNEPKIETLIAELAELEKYTTLYNEIYGKSDNETYGEKGLQAYVDEQRALIETKKEEKSILGKSIIAILEFALEPFETKLAEKKVELSNFTTITSETQATEQTQAKTIEKEGLEQTNADLQAVIDELQLKIQPTQDKIDALKITATVTVTISRYEDIVSQYGLIQENIDVAREFLESVMEEK